MVHTYTDNKAISAPSWGFAGWLGLSLAILEYKSQSNNNTDFLREKEKFWYIDYLSILEVINLILAGISSYNVRQQVPPDIKTSFYTAKIFRPKDISESVKGPKRKK